MSLSGVDRGACFCAAFPSLPFFVVMSRSTASKPPEAPGADDADDDPAAGVVTDAGGSGVEVREVKSLRNGTTVEWS